jgi:hypothetical protein
MRTRKAGIPASFFKQPKLNSEQGGFNIKIQLCYHTQKIWYTFQSSSFPKIRSNDYELSSNSISDLFFTIKNTFENIFSTHSIVQAKILTVNIIGEDLMPLYSGRTSILQRKELFDQAEAVLLNIEIKNRMAI